MQNDKKRNLGAIIIDELREKFLEAALKSIGKKEKLLDLGCGNKPYKTLYAQYCNASVGIDVPSTLHQKNNIDMIYDGEKIPFDNETFDIVLSTEVLEHVCEPKDFLKEIHRVLKPNGTAIITVPFLVPLHEIPYDYYRYTFYGLQYLLSQTNFNIVSIQTFAEYFGVLISFGVQIQLKFWNIVSKKTRIQPVYSKYNPFIFLLIYLPQKIYLYFYRIGLINKCLNKLNYTPKGYGLIITKK